MFKRPLLAALGLLLMVGCTNHTQIGAASVEPAYMPSQLGYASRPNGEMQVVVYGNPFRPGMSDPVFAETMALAMRGNHFGPPIAFTTKPSAPNPDRYKVVMQFTGDPALPGRDLCRFATRGEAPQSSESSGSVPVRMAFCVGPKLLTEVLAHLGGAGGITVEDTEKLVARMTINLLPPTNPVSTDPLDSDFKLL